MINQNIVIEGGPGQSLWKESITLIGEWIKQEMKDQNIVIEGSPDQGLWKVRGPRKKWMKAGTENQIIVTEGGQGQRLWRLSTEGEAGHPQEV